MTNQPGDSQEPGLQNAGSAEGTATTAAAGLSPAGDAQAPASGEAAPPKKLTAEEQMAQYEDDLKNTDWGHQPC